MPPDETLSAVVKIRDQASKKLESIANELDEVHDSALAAARGARSASDAFEKAEDKGSALDRALESLQDTAVEATGSLEAVDAAAESAGDSFEEAARDANSLDRALGSVNRSAAAATGSLSAAGVAGALSGTGADVGDVSQSVKKTVDTQTDGVADVEDTLDEIDGTTVRPEVKQSVSRPDDVDSEGFSFFGGDKDREGILGDFDLFGDDRDMERSVQRTMDSVSRTITEAFDVDLPDFAETRQSANELGNVFAGLPAFPLDVDSEEDFDEMAGNLQKIASSGDNVTRSLKSIDDDELIETVNSTRELRRALSRTDHGTTRTEQSLRSLEGASRDLFDELVATASGVDHFETQANQLGDRAIRTSGTLQGLEGQMRDIAIQATISADRTDEFGDEVSQAGRKSTSAMAQIKALDMAMSDLGPNIGDVSTRLAGFQTSLSMIAQLAPMMFSLAAALGAVATAGAAAAGGLGMILGGGLLAAGRELGGQMAATAGNAEDLEGPMKDAAEAQSEMGRTMAGVEELMSRVKEAAYEAMEPLMTDEFANFTLRVLEGAITLLHETAQGVAAMSDEFLEFADVVGASFWDTLPAIVGELNMLIEDFLTGQTTAGLIEAIPGILQAMRVHGNELIPLLSEMTGELIEMLPTLLELGTAMLKLLIPAVEGVAWAMNLLAPWTSMVADAIEVAALVLGPLIKGFFALMAPIYASSLLMSGFIKAAYGLYAIAAGAVSILGTMALRLATVAKVVYSAAAALGALVGVAASTVLIVGAIVGAVAIAITYFDLWDELLVGIARTWNSVVDAFSTGAGIIGDAIASVVNAAIKDINRLIKVANLAPTVDIDTVEEMELDWYDKYDEDKWDTEKARSVGETMNMGERGEGGSLVPTPDTGGPGGAGGPGGQGRRGRGYDNTATNIEEINIDSSPETNDAEIKRAAKEAIKEANKEERRRNSSLH